MKDYKPFQFKQFSIRQNHAAMKVGTDGILLGAWTKIHADEHILDIGTGTGLLSIMLAQKVNGKCRIDAIEIDDQAILDARFNIASCPWDKAIQLIHTDFNHFERQPLYNVIISNPPFYQGDVSSNQSRASARSSGHTLDINDLIAKSANLLTQDGRLNLIVPFENKNKIIITGERYQMQVKSILNIKPTPHKSPNRVIIEFIKRVEIVNPSINQIVIQNDSGDYSESFKKVTNAYYLNI